MYLFLFRTLCLIIMLKVIIKNKIIYEGSGNCSLCLGSIDSSETNFMVFGDPALMSMIALFDKETNSVGIFTP